MEKQANQRFKFRKLATIKKPEEDPVPKLVDNKIDINKALDQSIVYDYMKYPAKKKNIAKVQKNVTFKSMVELVTFTDNGKMKMIEGKLRTEEEQRKSFLKRRNF